MIIHFIDILSVFYSSLLYFRLSPKNNLIKNVYKITLLKIYKPKFRKKKKTRITISITVKLKESNNE